MWELKDRRTFPRLEKMMLAAQKQPQQITLDIHEATGYISLLVNQPEALPWGQTWANGVLGSNVAFFLYALPWAYLLGGNRRKVWRQTENKGPSYIMLSEILSCLICIRYFKILAPLQRTLLLAPWWLYSLAGTRGNRAATWTLLQQHFMMLSLAAMAAPGLQPCSPEGKKMQENRTSKCTMSIEMQRVSSKDLWQHHKWRHRWSPLYPTHPSTSFCWWEKSPNRLLNITAILKKWKKEIKWEYHLAKLNKFWIPPFPLLLRKLLLIQLMITCH